jgi:microcystin-dependent protein
MSSLNALGTGNSNPMPIGTIIWYANIGGSGDLGDSTWLNCDGRYLLRDEYPDLFYWIGDVFGTTDSSNFRLPQAQATNFNGTKGLLPLPQLSNTGNIDVGAGGTATLNATLVEANIPPMSWNGDGSSAGTGLDVTNSVWNSTIDNARNCAENDYSGGSSTSSGSTAKCVRHNTPATGISNITTSTPAVIDRTATATAITSTIDLRGELPSRFEMRMMIKAKY